MKTLILIVTLAAGVQGAMAQAPCGPGWKPQSVAARERIDAVQNETLEVEALYWAYRVAILRDITYEALVSASKNWLMSEEPKTRLLSMVRRHLDNGTARELTPEERQRYQAGLRKVRQMSKGAKAPKASLVEAKADETTCSIFELEARYWAWAVNTAKTVSMQQLSVDSRRWPGSMEVNTALMGKVRQLVSSGVTPPLSADETARKAAAKKALRDEIEAIKARP